MLEGLTLPAFPEARCCEHGWEEAQVSSDSCCFTTAPPSGTPSIAWWSREPPFWGLLSGNQEEEKAGVPLPGLSAAILTTVFCFALLTSFP